MSKKFKNQLIKISNLISLFKFQSNTLLATFLRSAEYRGELESITVSPCFFVRSSLKVLIKMRTQVAFEMVAGLEEKYTKERFDYTSTYGQLLMEDKPAGRQRQNMQFYRRLFSSTVIRVCLCGCRESFPFLPLENAFN